MIDHDLINNNNVLLSPMCDNQIKTRGATNLQVVGSNPAVCVCWTICPTNRSNDSKGRTSATSKILDNSSVYPSIFNKLSTNKARF